MSTGPACSVVIPTFNATATLGAQLEALADQSFEGELEVLVADNRSTDDLPGLLHAWAPRLPGLRRVDASRARGVAVARNEGVRAAATDRILICDADDVVTREWVAAFLRALDTHAFVGGSFETEVLSGRAASWVPVPRRSSGLLRGPGDLGYPIGCNTGFRREVFDDVGGYAEDYPPGGEEIDFAWRAREAGYVAEYVDEALVHYRIREDLRGVLRQQLNSGRGSSVLAARTGTGSVRSWPRQVHHELLLLGRLTVRGSGDDRRRWLAAMAFEVGRLREERRGVARDAPAAVSARPRVVLVTASVPYDDIPHAGGQYLLALTTLLAGESDLSVLGTNIPANRHALTRPRCPESVTLLGGRPGRGPAGRGLARAVALADRWCRTADPTLPPIAFVVGLLRDRRAMDLLRRADVVDLQWSEQVRLVGLVRRINPSARVVGTFHDVRSQQVQRLPAASIAARARRRLLALAAGRFERRCVAALDTAVVFSDKDAALLPESPTVAVVHPPLDSGRATRRRPSQGPLVTVVAYWARAENDAAARWLLERVWPSVAARVPDARMRIVGSGAGPHLQDAASRAPGVDLVGFVPDLSAEYARSWCVLVPLQSGAGVKFKTVEALTHGVPVVTTSVGAEGVGPTDWFAAVTDDPMCFADAVVEVLQHPQEHRERASSARELVAARYSTDQFRDGIRRAFGWPAGATTTPRRGDPAQ